MSKKCMKIGKNMNWYKKAQLENISDYIVNQIRKSNFPNENDFQVGDCSIFASNLASVLDNFNINYSVCVTVVKNEIQHVFLKIEGKYIDSIGLVKFNRLRKVRLEEFYSVQDAENFVEKNTISGSLHKMSFRVYSDLSSEIEEVLKINDFKNVGDNHELV